MIYRFILSRKVLTIAILLALATGLGVAQPQEVLAQDISQACEAIGDCEDGEDELQGVIEIVVNIFSVVIGIVAVIMIMVGGFKYTTSGGDSGKTASAKNTVIYAVIGLVIAALAQFIVHFILDNVL